MGNATLAEQCYTQLVELYNITAVLGPTLSFVQNAINGVSNAQLKTNYFAPLILSEALDSQFSNNNGNLFGIQTPNAMLMTSALNLLEGAGALTIAVAASNVRNVFV